MNYELDYYRKKLKQHYTHLETEWMSLQGLKLAGTMKTFDWRLDLDALRKKL